MGIEEATQSYYHRLSLAAFMHHHNYVPNIYYILNNKSKSDMNNHYQPFMEEIKKYNLDIDNKLTVWLYNDETRGHSPLLPDKTLEYLHTIMSFKHL